MKKFLNLYGNLPIGVCLMAAILTSSCTTGKDIDPYENFNRKVYSINMKFDKAVARPVAQAYNEITPKPMQKGISNFFSNIDTLVSIPNDILQGKALFAISDSWRFLFNTTIGMAGLFDVATPLGIPAHHEDFGLTLATWDPTAQQAYLQIPVLGPSGTRDFPGYIGNYIMTPWLYLNPIWVSYAAVVENNINTRSQLLAANRLLDDSFDPYIFMRDAYLQSRAQQIKENKLSYDQFVAKKQSEKIPVNNAKPNVDNAKLHANNQKIHANPDQRAPSQAHT